MVKESAKFATRIVPLRVVIAHLLETIEYASSPVQVEPSVFNQTLLKRSRLVEPCGKWHMAQIRWRQFSWRFIGHWVARSAGWWRMDEQNVDSLAVGTLIGDTFGRQIDSMVLTGNWPEGEAAGAGEENGTKSRKSFYNWDKNFKSKNHNHCWAMNCIMVEWQLSLSLSRCCVSQIQIWDTPKTHLTTWRGANDLAVFDGTPCSLKM